MLSAIRLSEIRIEGKTQSCLEMASSTRTMLQHGLKALRNGGKALIEISFRIILGVFFQTLNIDCWLPFKSGVRGKPVYHNG